MAALIFMLFYSNAGDKVKRAVKYMFHQGTFYPLTPPHLDVCLDSGLAQKYASLSTVPNMLIVASDLRSFIRVSYIEGR